MAIKIGANIGSLQAQRSLSEATSSLSKTYAKLSSGQRINTSSDDAAGLAIAESLRSDSKVFLQAIRNLNDGISYLSTGQAALGALTNITVRLKELAEQAANGAYSTKQRVALDTEANSLAFEYNRIIQSTKFNGKNILDISSNGSELSLQAGYGSNSRIASSIGNDLARVSGSGQFGTLSQTGVFDAAGSITYNTALDTGDFNGDGKSDIITINESGISIFFGNGTGTSFTEGINNNAKAIVPANTGLAVADFNGDGKDDVVYSSGVVFGGAANTSTAVVSLGAVSLYSIAAADFNSDGKMDIIGFNSSTGRLNLFTGNGSGSFSASVVSTQTTLSGNIAIGDFNLDGKVDVVANSSSTGLTVLSGNGNGTFNQGSSSVFGNTQAFQISAGDFNSDGASDFAFVDSTGSIQIAVSQGNSFYLKNPGVPSGIATQVKVADMDADGLADLVVKNEVNGTTETYFNDSFLSFTSSKVSLSSASAADIVLSDLNRDGFLDFVGGFSTNIGWALQSTSTSSTGIFLDLTTQTGARAAIGVLETQQQRIGLELGKLGAFESRVNAAMRHLTTSTENLLAAESRIRSADIAEESANLIRDQVKQQAATAILAQANQNPSLVMQLLKF